MVERLILGKNNTLQPYMEKCHSKVLKTGSINDCAQPRLECFGGFYIPRCQFNYHKSNWKARTRHL